MLEDENMKEHEHLEWKEESKEDIFDAKIFTLAKVRRSAQDGRKAEFYVLDSPDWVNVIPLLKDDTGRDCFLMVRQYRHGSETVTLEFPGGMVGEGEKPEEAARRELLEETGYQAGDLEELGVSNPNPAFMTNNFYTFLAQNLEWSASQVLDEHEIVDTELVPVSDITDRVNPSFHIHAIMVVALYWYNLRHGDKA